MTILRSVSAASWLLLSACVSSGEPTTNGPQFLEELPEGLAEAAAPGQNMAAVIIDQNDGCYWYQHAGVVETTFLPLRTNDGRPICSRPRE